MSTGRTPHRRGVSCPGFEPTDAAPDTAVPRAASDKGELQSPAGASCTPMRATCWARHTCRRQFSRRHSMESGARVVHRPARGLSSLREDAMPQVDWYIEGIEVSNCNCDYACPCQFEFPRPTHGHCRGFAAVRIDKGHFGDVALDGLCAALLYRWPGPIYEGHGECQAVVDEQANDNQRDALAA